MAEAQAPTPMEIATAKISGIPLPQPAAAEEPAPAPQAEASEQPESQLEGQPSEGTEPDSEPQGSEVEEIEFDGVKFSLPKEHVQKVKEALMRTADYTQKTQTVAERERVIAEQQKLFEAQSQFHQSSIDDIAQIRALDQAIAQYANVNWMAMQTDELMRTRLQYDQLKEARETAQKGLDAKWRQFNQSREESIKKLAEAGRQEAARRIPGLNDKSIDDLKSYAKKAGYQEQQINAMLFNPLDVEMIWKAQQFDALKASKAGIQNRANQAPPVLKPGATKPQQSADQKQLVSFYAAKDKAAKEKIGAEILARKLRM